MLYIYILAIFFSIYTCFVSFHYKIGTRHFFVGYIFCLFLIFLLITSNRVGNDIVNYNNKYIYFYLDISPIELVYKILSYISYRLGLSFYLFRAVLTFVLGAMAFSTLQRFNINLAILFVFYLPSIIFMDSMQVKNSFALYILIWASKFLIDDKIKHRKIKFFISVLLMGGFHTAFFYYFFLLFIDVTHKQNKKLTYLYLLFVIILSLVTFANGNKIPFLNKIFSILLSKGDSRKDLYMTSGHLGFVYPTILLFTMVCTISYCKRRVILLDKKENNFITLTNYLNLSCLFFIPFMMMNITYYRFVRNTFMFNIIASLILFKKGNKEVHYLLSIFLIFNTFCWWLFDTRIYESSKLIVDPVLKYGEFFYK